MVEQMVQQRRMGNGEARMNPLYACVHAAEFPVQALLRLRPDLASQPIAVLAGRPPLEFVCSLNTTAMRRGITLDMTRLHVEALGAVTVLRRSTAAHLSAVRTRARRPAAGAPWRSSADPLTQQGGCRPPGPEGLG